MPARSKPLSGAARSDAPVRATALAGLVLLLLSAAAAAAPVTTVPAPTDLYKPFRVAGADTHNQRHASAGDDLLVWADDRDWPGGTDGEHEIYSYNFTTGAVERLTQEPSSKTFPRTSQGWVVWADDRDGATHIWARDPATKEERRITPTTAAQTSPDLSYPWVVYKQAAQEAGTFEVYAYNLATGDRTKVTPAPGLHLNPVVGGELVAWTEVEDIEVSGVVESTIRGHHLGTGESRVVVAAENEQSSPDVDYPFIVWQDSRPGSNGWDLYSYQWETRSERALVRAPGDQSFPQLSWPHLAWRDTRHLGEDQDSGHSVYWQDLSTTDPARRITDATHSVQNELALGARFVGWIEFREGGGGGAFDVWAARLVAASVTGTPTPSLGQELTNHPVDAAEERSPSAAWSFAVAAALIAAVVARRRR